MDLTTKEIGTLAVFTLFIAFWSFIFVPQFQLWIQQTDSPNPIFFYPTFNAVYIVLFTFLTYMLLRILGKRGKFTDLLVPAFRLGLAGFVLLWMIPDLVAPPYLVTMDGQLLKTHPLWAAVSDSFWYTILQAYVPSSAMYVTLYFGVPVAMFVVVLLLVSPKQLASLVKKL